MMYFCVRSVFGDRDDCTCVEVLVALFLGRIAVLHSTYFTFRVSRTRRKMYSGHSRLSVCLFCVFAARRIPTLLHGPERNLGQ